MYVYAVYYGQNISRNYGYAANSEWDFCFERWLLLSGQLQVKRGYVNMKNS
jgi:hypothetical protein